MEPGAGRGGRGVGAPPSPEAGSDRGNAPAAGGAARRGGPRDPPRIFPPPSPLKLHLREKAPFEWANRFNHIARAQGLYPNPVWSASSHLGSRRSSEDAEGPLSGGWQRKTASERPSAASPPFICGLPWYLIRTSMVSCISSL